MVRAWLITSAFMVILMIFIGGLTRLTDSGLSMTDWKPITGWLPPIGEKAWVEEFSNYQKSPEFQKINFDFSIEDFKNIFWLEYLHRILGRITALIIICPYLYFAFKGRITHHKPYIGICILVLLQGLMGWYMVKSGLVDNPHVSHYRLAIHLMAAIFLYMMILWRVFDDVMNHPTGGKLYSWILNKVPDNSLMSSRPLSRDPGNTTRSVIFLTLALILTQIFLGALTAGLDAGLIYNEFPLMGGSYMPSEFELSLNMLNDPASLQFLHRNMGYVAGIIVLYLAFRIYKDSWQLSYLLTATIAIQIFLGIVTLIYQVPVKLALAHQLFAVLCLSIILYIMRRSYD